MCWSLLCLWLFRFIQFSTLDEWEFSIESSIVTGLQGKIKNIPSFLPIVEKPASVHITYDLGG